MPSILYSSLLGLCFVGGTVAVSMMVYALGRWALVSPEYLRHKDMAGSMIVRIGALHALILALVFAQEMTAYQRLDGILTSEADAVADIYNDAARYGPAALPVRDDILRYTHLVTQQEWPDAGSAGRLSDHAWDAWDAAYRKVLDLTPANPAEESLRANMLTRIHDISKARDQRERRTTGAVFGLFWFAAVSGVVLISVGYYIYPPERQNLILMALFSAYTGIVLFMIFAFSNPYRYPAALQPDEMRAFQAEIAPP